MMKNFNKQSAQTFIEYTLLLGIVVLFLVAISPLIRRSTQGFVRLVADQVGTQDDADQSTESGYMVSTDAQATSLQKGRTIYDLNEITLMKEDQEKTSSHQISNLGYSEK